MRIPLDPQSRIPLYQQIESHIRGSILSGSLPADTRLPASRQLARDLGVNRATVENAYSALEAGGLVFSRMGSGTYVLPVFPLPDIPKKDSGDSLPLWQANLQRNIIPNPDALDEALQAGGHPRPISFASGISDSRLFPAEEFRRALQTAMRRDGIDALEYGERKGYAPLRKGIAQILASQGLQAHPENILITAGSQQAIFLASQILLRPGDVILVEDPTYSAAIDLFRALGFQIVGIPVDGQGMQVERLETILQLHHPKLIYTMPNFHNPTGTCLSSPRRRQLILLAERYNVPILEDDFVGDLRYEGHAQPSLKSLDAGGQVIYVGTFSKMLMPGLRVGFIVADGPVYDSLLNFKRLSDLATSTLIQRALDGYMTVGRYQTYLHRSCQVFRQRRDAMVNAIRRHFPKEVSFEIPKGGLFIWLKLPNRLSSNDLLGIACKEGAAFSPGSSFFLDGEDGDHWIRLNFASQPVEDIEEGIKRLGAAIRRMTSKRKTSL
ncbi:MAG: PLP-dependent aminotransferase family protein [Chloroflexi bacterium]|nr:PLP-dependent aminotransferase family protein [Chloroflexi bacterium CFX1]MCK6567026.1 PLP-dependent aminotransferase family protein [Anaerolineales bacterium]MCQ3952514.1 PLP-dependent aminotransferase family protein [Chloroflexota bacterium]MDL1918943.1 PLP-dependent aminotransferase family protein [Chloroflexi bacterium CFX5]NUQ59826.1 PLP-dependent aminotransferase family protein [Anaerolineales bacterium]